MTCRRICRRFADAIAIVACLATSAAAQNVPTQLLQQPTRDSWPTYHGDYTGQHHSRLTQITPANVSQLALAIPMCLLYEVGLWAARIFIKTTQAPPEDSGTAVEKS